MSQRRGNWPALELAKPLMSRIEGSPKEKAGRVAILTNPIRFWLALKIISRPSGDHIEVIVAMTKLVFVGDTRPAIHTIQLAG